MSIELFSDFKKSILSPSRSRSIYVSTTASLGTNRSRRSFLKQSAASTLLALTPAGRLILAQEPVDLLITGGRLIDPYQRSNQLARIDHR